VSAKARTLPRGAWITGYGWSEDQVEEKRKPNRKDLDQSRAGKSSGINPRGADTRALAIHSP